MAALPTIVRGCLVRALSGTGTSISSRMGAPFVAAFPRDAAPAGALVARAAAAAAAGGSRNWIEGELYNRARNVMALGSKRPVLVNVSYAAPSSVIVGDVDVDDKVRGPTSAGAG